MFIQMLKRYRCSCRMVRLYPIVAFFKKTIKQSSYIPTQKYTYHTTSQYQQKVLQRRLFSDNSKSLRSLGKLNKNPKKRILHYLFMFLRVGVACLGVYAVYIIGAPEKDEHGNPVRDDYSEYAVVRAYIRRFFRELGYYRKLFKEPSKEKLLPDPLPFPYVQPKYTLVVELKDVLVHHPDWATGWQFKKRPLLTYFLESLQDQYEIVIYTSEHGMVVFPVIDAIDPKNIIAHKLVRDATAFVGGHYVKRLDNINRDLSKVVVIDWDCHSLISNKKNLFCIKRWTGNPDDTSLLDLVGFLKIIADYNIEDVREVLNIYSKYDDPIMAFRNKQKKLIDTLEEQEEQRRTHEEHKSRWPHLFF